MTAPCWEVLGIEATQSERDVKRAYAGKLRETRPEDDPVAFQALHEAYQQALWLARHGASLGAPVAGAGCVQPGG